MKNLMLLPLLFLLSGCNEPLCKANQITIGMTEEDLIATCGNTKKSHNGSSTQWVYRGSQDLYVYTENGKVRSMQWID